MPMNPIKTFRNLRIGYKLLFGYTALFFVVMGLASFAVYSMIENSIREQVEDQLITTTSTIVSMVETAADVSIKNNLRAAAEQSRQIIEGVHDIYESGFISERWAKWQAERLLLHETIGKTGYIYVLDSNGRVLIHPNPGVRLSDASDFNFVGEQVARREGYLEYEWRNPGEPEPREKALYMTYFKPWDWIISASSYRSDFADLVNIDDFREDISRLRIGEHGYPFLIATDGEVLVHPHMQGGDFMLSKTRSAEVMRRIADMKTGRLEYIWQNPGESEPRRKLVTFEHLPEYGWIVASSVYLDEVYEPLEKVRNIILAVALAALVLFSLVTLAISRSITRPLADLAGRLEKGAEGDLSVRAKSRSRDEIGRLAAYFNTFMDELGNYNQSLKEQIEERRRSEEILRESEEKYRQVVENTSESIVVINEDRHVFFNERFAVMTGYTSSEILEKPNSEMIHEEDRDAVTDLRTSQLNNIPAPHSYVFRLINKSGEMIWVQVNEVRIDWEGSPAILSFMYDITIRKKVEDSLNRQKAFFTQLFENSPQAIALISQEGEYLDVNRAFETLFGYSREEVVQGRGVIVPEGRKEDSDSLREKVLNGESMFIESLRLHRNGDAIPVSILGYPFRIQGRNAGAFFVFNDISERKEYEQKLTHLALHDSLTGLPNRALFMERLGRAMSRGARRSEYRFAVFMIDLDRFKQVNDTMGHLVGDNLLIEVGSRLIGCVRDMDTVARLGGDEFAVIVEEFNTREEVIQIVQRILREVELPMDNNGTAVRTSASAGIVLDTRHYDAPESILRDADISMYKAKEQGKNRFRIFTPAMHTETVEAVALENEMRNAIPRGEFFLQFQPIQSLSKGKVVGFEALVRWMHPRRGLLGPENFIPLAEDSGMIVDLGHWIIKKACETMAEWRRTMPAARDLALSINLSAKQISQPDLVENIKSVLEFYDLPPKMLRLEITETCLTRNTDAILQVLKSLKKLGVQLSIDDFGTGYSSLSYLQQFPVDTLKVDRSFISRISSHPEDIEIVRAVVLLAHSLGMDVVAEGVEKLDQLNAIKGLDCEYVQGFYFSRPMDPDKIEQIIRGMG